MQVEKMQQRIEKIKSKLQSIGDMRPGSLNEQYTKCGTAGCACHDIENPKRHGPYNQLSYVHKGRSTTQFIQKSQLRMVKKQLANYKTYRALTAEWVDLALAVAKEKLKIAKKNSMKK